MQSNLPLVTVGLPIYNRPEGLRNTLECFINQTYKNIEIIIADNCSPDPEVEKIAKEYCKKDHRISYYRHTENKGWGFNTVFVMEKANGEYFMRATDDDWWDKDFINKILSKILSKKTAVFGVSNFIEVDPKGCKSRSHIENHLPLLKQFSTDNKEQNLLNFIKQFEGYGKSNLYFGIFKLNLLNQHYIKDLLYKQILSCDILICFYVLTLGDLIIEEKTLLKLTFDNEKYYEQNINSKKSYFYDYVKVKSVYSRWKFYFIELKRIVKKSELDYKIKSKIKKQINRRIVLFIYDTFVLGLKFKKIRRKAYLE